MPIPVVLSFEQPAKKIFALKNGMQHKKSRRKAQSNEYTYKLTRKNCLPLASTQQYMFIFMFIHQNIRHNVQNLIMKNINEDIK